MLFNGRTKFILLRRYLLTQLWSIGCIRRRYRCIVVENFVFIVGVVNTAVLVVVLVFAMCIVVFDVSVVVIADEVTVDVIVVVVAVNLIAKGCRCYRHCHFVVVVVNNNLIAHQY